MAGNLLEIGLQNDLQSCRAGQITCGPEIFFFFNAVGCPKSEKMRHKKINWAQIEQISSTAVNDMKHAKLMSFDFPHFFAFWENYAISKETYVIEPALQLCRTFRNSNFNLFPATTNSRTTFRESPGRLMVNLCCLMYGNGGYCTESWTVQHESHGSFSFKYNLIILIMSHAIFKR